MMNGIVSKEYMNKTPCNIDELVQIAHELRISVTDMIYKAGSGHIGGSFSICEILSVLYCAEMDVDPANPKDPNRDRFILSKGHGAPALYAILAKKGFFSEKELSKLRRFGSILQGHPDMKKVSGVEMSTGSPGMGISCGIGMALGRRLNGLTYRVYVLTGCGELDEGQNWEAFMAGSKYALNNLVVIIDYNRVQLDGSNDEIMPLGDLVKKITSFNWNVIECDGHNISQLIEVFEKVRGEKERPTAIVAHTIKGKGVSFMENRHEWHGKPLDDETYSRVMSELKGRMR